MSNSSNPVILCSPKFLPSKMNVKAARTAIGINPANAPLPRGVAALISSVAIATTDCKDDEECPTAQETVDSVTKDIIKPAHLALLTQKYWGSAGVKLSVSFTEPTQDDLAQRILSHMNAWSTIAGANVEFSMVKPGKRGQVRISREPGGYWSYLGTDILHVPNNEQTMNLEGFTMSTPESEYVRVVRHETGHTLGFPHEHLRAALVNKLDYQKTVKWFDDHQGWSEQETIQQVLKPIEESALLNPTEADSVSIMCYQLPGDITKDGKPIIGGVDIDKTDMEYARKVYPPLTPAPTKRKKKTIIITSDTDMEVEIRGNELPQ